MGSPKVGMQIKFAGKDELIAALNARRSWAERTDKKRQAAHEKDEKAYLAEFQKRCKAALTWDYETAKANSFEVRMSRYDDGLPSCPTSRVAKLDALLARLALTSQQQFTLNEGDVAHHLLTHDDDVKVEAC